MDINDQFELLPDNAVIENNNDYFYDWLRLNREKSKMVGHVGNTVSYLKSANPGIIIYRKIEKPLFECIKGFPWGY